MSGKGRGSDNTDQNVLTIFLPLLAVALTACAGACCYMERKRRQKLKKGAVNLQEDQHISDVESVISTSSRHRPYLQPSQTTGRTFRTPSRTGSVRSTYSSYGEPPPYSGKNSRRSSLASTKALNEDGFRRKAQYNSGYERSHSSLSRSRSLLDVGREFEPAPLRRTRSSSNIEKYGIQNNHYSSNERSRYDVGDFNLPRSRRESVTQPQNGLMRPARQQMGASMDDAYVYDRPSSIASFSARGARSSMRRSASQPNLRNKIAKTGTYPQGILKRNGAPNEIERFKQGPSSVSGGSMVGKRTFSQMDDAMRPPSSLKPGYGAGRNAFDPYDTASNYSAYGQVPARGAFNGSAAPSATIPRSYTQYAGNRRDLNQKYPPSFDPYSYNDNYWDHGAAAQAQQAANPYMYGSGMY